MTLRSPFGQTLAIQAPKILNIEVAHQHKKAPETLRSQLFTCQALVATKTSILRPSPLSTAFHVITLHDPIGGGLYYKIITSIWATTKASRQVAPATLYNPPPFEHRAPKLPQHVLPQIHPLPNMPRARANAHSHVPKERQRRCLESHILRRLSSHTTKL